jgi:hypothetical protein
MIRDGLSFVFPLEILREPCVDKLAKRMTVVLDPEPHAVDNSLWTESDVYVNRSSVPPKPCPPIGLELNCRLCSFAGSGLSVFESPCRYQVPCFNYRARRSLEKFVVLSSPSSLCLQTEFRRGRRVDRSNPRRVRPCLHLLNERRVLQIQTHLLEFCKKRIEHSIDEIN